MKRSSHVRAYACVKRVTFGFIMKSVLRVESVRASGSLLLQFELLLPSIIDKLVNNRREASLRFLNHQNENLQEHIFRRISPVSEFVESEFWREVVKNDEPVI